jgi:hypothetical protein
MAEFHTPRRGSSSNPPGGPQPVQPGPAMGVDEGSQGGGAVRAVGVHGGQRGRAQHLCRGLDFPQQVLGLRVAEVIEVLHLDDVQASLDCLAVVRFDRTHGPQPVADANGLADFRVGWRHGRHGAFQRVCWLPVVLSSYPSTRASASTEGQIPRAANGNLLNYRASVWDHRRAAEEPLNERAGTYAVLADRRGLNQEMKPAEQVSRGEVSGRASPRPATTGPRSPAAAGFATALRDSLMGPRCGRSPTPGCGRRRSAGPSRRAPLRRRAGPAW